MAPVLWPQRRAMCGEPLRDVPCIRPPTHTRRALCRRRHPGTRSPLHPCPPPAALAGPSMASPDGTSAAVGASGAESAPLPRSLPPPPSYPGTEPGAQANGAGVRLPRSNSYEDAIALQELSSRRGGRGAGAPPSDSGTDVRRTVAVRMEAAEAEAEADEDAALMASIICDLSPAPGASVSASADAVGSKEPAVANADAGATMTEATGRLASWTASDADIAENIAVLDNEPTRDDRDIIAMEAVQQDAFDADSPSPIPRPRLTAEQRRHTLRAVKSRQLLNTTPLPQLRKPIFNAAWIFLGALLGMLCRYYLVSLSTITGIPFYPIYWANFLGSAAVGVFVEHTLFPWFTCVAARRGAARRTRSASRSVAVARRAWPTLTPAFVSRPPDFNC